MKNFKKIAAFFSLPFLIVSSANAVYIDFCSPVFQAANGQNTFIATNVNGSGIDMKLLASPNTAKLTVNTVANDNANDGIGINDDEITGGTSELLTIDFLNTAVNLTKIDITDLFYEDGYREIGYYNVNNDLTWVPFQAGYSQTPGTTNGLLSLNVNLSDVKAIVFKGEINNTRSDFSLKGLQATAVKVPEPASLSLIGFGLITLVGMGVARRKKS